MDKRLFFYYIFGTVFVCVFCGNEDQSPQVIRAFPETIEHLLYLKDLELNPAYDFWLEPKNIDLPVDIMAQGKKLRRLKSDLKRIGIAYDIFIRDVEFSARNNVQLNMQAFKEEGNSNFSWSAYHPYDEIVQWMKSMAALHPDKVNLIQIGQSYESRPMYVARVSSSKKWKTDRKPSLWIDGGMHGREWISPAVVTYMMNQLIQNPVHELILRKVDFYFMPVMNPDGYAHTFTKNGRLWKKTRSRQKTRLDCIGVDLNRNWGFEWKESMLTSYTCSESYPGNAPFSEREIQLTRREIMVNRLRIKAHISYHSYAQTWFFPWGYTHEKVEDFEDYAILSSRVVEAIHTYRGMRYRQAPLCMHEGLCTNGDYIDWMKAVPRVKYSFQVQLPDLGNHGYLLPPWEIVPTGEESLRGLLVVARTVAEDKYKKSVSYLTTYTDMFILY